MTEANKLLLTIKEAAGLLNVLAARLQRAAEEHGFLILIGRAARVERAPLDDLVNCCRTKPRTISSDRQATLSADPNAAFERALKLVEEGKKRPKL